MGNCKVFIVNGRPNCGKTLFKNMIKEKLGENKVGTLSIIDDVCSILDFLGINSLSKNEDIRLLKNDIKRALDKYHDFVFAKTQTKIDKMIKDGKTVVFCDMREKKDIDKARCSWDARTVFIDRDVPMITSNHADGDVENILYDVYVDNNGTLENLSEAADTFINEFIKEK